GGTQNIPGLADSAIPNDFAASYGGGHGGAPGGGGDGGGGVHSPITAAYPADAKLFPRASVPSNLHRSQVPTIPASAGPTEGTTMGGMPMGGMGSGMNGGQNAAKEHKRAKFLDTVDNFDEAVGPEIERVRPVIDA